MYSTRVVVIDVERLWGRRVEKKGKRQGRMK
jgi:hypothetical protein